MRVHLSGTSLIQERRGSRSIRRKESPSGRGGGRGAGGTSGGAALIRVDAVFIPSDPREPRPLMPEGTQGQRAGRRGQRGWGKQGPGVDRCPQGLRRDHAWATPLSFLKDVCVITAMATEGSAPKYNQTILRRFFFQTRSFALVLIEQRVWGGLCSLLRPSTIGHRCSEHIPLTPMGINTM